MAQDEATHNKKKWKKSWKKARKQKTQRTVTENVSVHHFFPLLVVYCLLFSFSSRASILPSSFSLHCRALLFVFSLHFFSPFFSFCSCAASFYSFSAQPVIEMFGVLETVRILWDDHFHPHKNQAYGSVLHARQCRYEHISQCDGPNVMNRKSNHCFVYPVSPSIQFVCILCVEYFII